MFYSYEVWLGNDYILSIYSALESLSVLVTEPVWVSTASFVGSGLVLVGDGSWSNLPFNSFRMFCFCPGYPICLQIARPLSLPLLTIARGAWWEFKNKMKGMCWDRECSAPASDRNSLWFVSGGEGRAQLVARCVCHQTHLLWGGCWYIFHRIIGRCLPCQYLITRKKLNCIFLYGKGSLQFPWSLNEQSGM